MQFKLPLMITAMAFGAGCSELPPKEVGQDTSMTVIDNSSAEDSVSRELDRIVQKRVGEDEKGRAVID